MQPTADHDRDLPSAPASLGDLLSRTPGVADIDFDVPDRTETARPINLT